MRRAAALLAAVGALACGDARAEPGLLVGLADDTLKSTPEETARVARDLGVRAFSLSVPWRRGMTFVPPDTAASLQTAVTAAAGARVVLWIHGDRGSAPQTDADRDAYCAFARDALARFPQVRDVVVWNEPNLDVFWAPQYGPDGSSRSPAAYAALLERCWDVLHAFRADVNVVAPATSPWGNDEPFAASNVSHSPARFLLALGAAYRASGRTRPLFDVLGHHPYPAASNERPWRTHTSSKTISTGDLDRLVAAAREAFEGTAQPTPGRGLPVWYLEAGYQTVPDPDKRGLYRGEENWPGSLPDWAGGEPDEPPPSADSAAPDQATQLVDALRLAYCQPYVQAFFNFQLRDEPSLERWQSGLLWADGTPKDSYDAFRRAVAEVNGRAVDCSRLKGTARPAAAPQPATGPPSGPAARPGPRRLGGADGRLATRLRWVSRNPSPYGLARLAARLTSTGRPLRGRTVAFEVGRHVYASLTTRRGLASIRVSPPLPPGSHVVVATFRGGPGHRPAAATVLLRVTRSRAVVSARASARAAAGRRDAVLLRSNGRRVTGLVDVRAGARRVVARRLTALGVAPDRRTAWFAGRTLRGATLLGRVELRRGRPDTLRLWLGGRQLPPVRGLDLRIGRGPPGVVAGAG